MWFADAGLQVVTLDDYLEGSPFDRNVFIGLLIAGCAVLISRRRMLSNFISGNRWLWAFFILCGISCLWSDYAFASLKRYIKDIGNLIMVLIIITETESGQALKSVLSRYTYLVIPFSVLFMIYFPEFGRYYDHGSGQPVYCGITTNKNGLGQVTFICGIFLIWDFISTRNKGSGALDKLDLLMRGILLAMLIWLLKMAHSSTSIVCMCIGIFLILFLNSSFGKRQIRNLGMWTMGFLFIFIIIFTIPSLLELFTGILGRDATLTGRTDAWLWLLKQPINPLLGSGYQSFWQTPAAAKFGEKFYFIPTQAHNGYLEVYIQTGIISLLLLLGAIVASISKLKKMLLLESTYSILLFAYTIIILISNWTEATFNKVNILWFILIIALLYYPKDFLTNPETDKTEPVNNTNEVVTNE
jgi:O-antigen ligase